MKKRPPPMLCVIESFLSGPARDLPLVRGRKDGSEGRTMANKINPRYSNGSLRRKNRARLRAMGCECGICHGRLGPIHYDEPSDSKHPLSFVVDEIIPVSRWREFGYKSARGAAEDFSNLQAAHYICNQRKSNHLPNERPIFPKQIANRLDGEW